MRAVGRRIAELRRGRGFTQSAFSEALDTTVGYVRRLEAGAENLTIRSLTEAANALHVPAIDLFRAPTDAAVRKGRPPSRVQATARTRRG